MVLCFGAASEWSKELSEWQSQSEMPTGEIVVLPHDQSD